MKKIKVLIIDDSALIRQLLSQGLALDNEIEIVGTAIDPYNARDKIVELHPDVLTLDVEMPKMDGVQFLKKLMPQYPIPVIMVSSLTEKGKKITLDALEAGAIDFITKPKADLVNGMNKMLNDLVKKIKIASTVDVSHWKGKKRTVIKRLEADNSLDESTHKIIAIGASTGGTEAIKQVVAKFPATFPGVVIVQHMPAGFTKMFADKLNSLCAMEVKEAEEGDIITPGKILIAPGDHHLEVKRSGGLYRAILHKKDKVSGHRPSVDVLFKSVAEHVGKNAIGVILTGMGRDGADNLLTMRDAGARTIAQDEKTSVVYGMPREATINGGAEYSLPIDKIAEKVKCLLSKI
ncbi:MAG: chemotaxis response regulator protein-glutamate methylesterase [Candidatus Delongbacteria bacterium]|nr:chemotaxis response regulator protein-glutamate methylesterase [Candidatus Delongbacteria bacterium]MBN2836406.1 chemotaxis response regulator protein-glutamate methylesterase [Candidatus Delongbacteria bacterium]